MRVRRRFTVLGCASSPGVPRITGDWGACDPSEPRNRRSRASLLVEQFGEDGGLTTAVIDTGPDFREQMIAAGVEKVDAVLYTHPHADHIHGIDDLRGFALATRRRVPIHAEAETLARLYDAFGYCFKTPPGSGYPPILEANEIHVDAGAVRIDGDGGPIDFVPLLQNHGDIYSLGFRIGDFAYCCDVSGFPPGTVARLDGLDVLIVDALQYKRHPSHLSLEEALEWIDRLKPRRAYLTHMHTPLDYARVMRETPDNVEPCYDGLRIEREDDI